MGMEWLSQTQHSHYSLVGDQNTVTQSVRFLKALRVVLYVSKFLKLNDALTFS